MARTILGEPLFEALLELSLRDAILAPRADYMHCVGQLAVWQLLTDARLR